MFSNQESSDHLKIILAVIKNSNNLLGYENFKEMIATRKDGSLFPAEIQIGKRFVQNQCLIALTIRDISKKKQDEEKIKHMAYHDSLTNLPNRRLYNEELTIKFRQAKEAFQPLAMLYLDMDRFKYINDSLGHLMGDRMLQEIAKRLSANIRKDDLARKDWRR